MRFCFPIPTRNLPGPLNLALLTSCFVCSALSLGCGDDDGTPDTDAGARGDGAVEDQVKYDETFAGECLGTTSCESFEVETACTCANAPLTDIAFTSNRVGCSQLPTEAGKERTPEDDDCDGDAEDAAPDIACMMPGSYRVRGESRDVTLFGVVDVFGNGGDADAITVEVFREGPDGALGAQVGTAGVSSVASPCSETEDEIDNDEIVGTRDLGFYRIDGVPTETPLIIKTSGNPDFWRPLYTYNFEIPNDEVQTEAPGVGACADLPTGERHRYKASVLSRSDYVSIPRTSGLVTGITRGNGVVAGEVHDCANVRVEFAQIAVNPPAMKLVYFNDNPSNPLPVAGRTEGTSMIGLYAALDVPAGPVDVAAVGRVAEGVVSFGWYRAQVFADSVTVVTLRGLRPEQTQ